MFIVIRSFIGYNGQLIELTEHKDNRIFSDKPSALHYAEIKTNSINYIDQIESVSFNTYEIKKG